MDVQGLRNFSGRGDVTCVEVTRDTTFAGDPGSVASLQAALDEPVDIGVFVARSIHLFVFDDGAHGGQSLDFIGFELSPLPAATGPSCLFDGFFGFSGQGSGRANVLLLPPRN